MKGVVHHNEEKNSKVNSNNTDVRRRFEKGGEETVDEEDLIQPDRGKNIFAGEEEQQQSMIDNGEISFRKIAKDNIKDTLIAEVAMESYSELEEAEAIINACKDKAKSNNMTAARINFENAVVKVKENKKLPEEHDVNKENTVYQIQDLEKYKSAADRNNALHNARNIWLLRINARNRKRTTSGIDDIIKNWQDVEGKSSEQHMIFWAQAEQANWMARKNRDMAASRLSSDNIKEKELWMNAKEADEVAAKKWKETLEAKRNALLNIEKGKANLKVTTNLEAEIVWAKAEQMRSQARGYEIEARLSEIKYFGNKNHFNSLWSNAKTYFEYTRDEWEKVVQLLEINNDTELEGRLGEAKYWKNFYKVKPFWIDAMKEEKIYNQAKAKAINIDYNDNDFEEIWEEVIRRAENASNCYKKLCKEHNKLITDIPEDQKKNWQEDVKRTQFLTDLYKARLIFMMAKKDSKNGLNNNIGIWNNVSKEYEKLIGCASLHDDYEKFYVDDLEDIKVEKLKLKDVATSWWRFLFTIPNIFFRLIVSCFS